MTTKQQEPAQVSLPNDREVVVTRTFSAPRALVFRAYTEPALMQRWLKGPPGWSMPVCEMDLREGGTYRWGWRSDEDGKEFGFHGVFKEVDPPARIRHTQHYDPGDMGGSMGEAGESMVAVSFQERDGTTTVTTRISYASKEARDAAMASGMTDGMELSYQSLDRLLSESGTQSAGS
jgi:uncharacterized protein YndB with AHSA1/START domain